MAQQAGSSSFVTGKLFRILVILIVIAISVAVFMLGDRIETLAAIGYPGIFFMSVLSNATIILPAPFLALVFALGSALPPVYVGLAAGVGGALGELSGYAAGLGGRAVIENRAAYDRVKEFMRRHGDVTILVLSFLPNPFFDLAGMAAGALHFPLWRFLLMCLIGKTLKTTLVALAGAWGFTLIKPYL